MKINKVSNSRVEADLYKSLSKFNLKRKDGQIEKTALLPLLKRLLSVSTMLTGATVGLNYATKKYFEEGPDAPELSVLFAENQNFQDTFGENGDRTSQHIKENRDDLNIFFHELNNYSLLPAEEEEANKNSGEEKPEEKASYDSTKDESKEESLIPAEKGYFDELVFV